MFQGRVVQIQIAKAPGEPMEKVESAKAVAGRGLEGDRYYEKTGTFSKKDGPSREVTLVEAEAIEGYHRDYGVEMDAAESRRNVVTEGVPLNHLVGKEFTIGNVRLRGLKLCEPCGHLAKLTGKNVLPGLVHRGGLRAQVLSDGTVRVGDEIAPGEASTDDEILTPPEACEI